MIKGEDFVVGGYGSNPNMALFVVLICYSKIFPNANVAVDEELEKIIIAIYSSTVTYIGDNESGYKYSSGETTETSRETDMACLQLMSRLHDTTSCIQLDVWNIFLPNCHDGECWCRWNYSPIMYHNNLCRTSSTEKTSGK